MSLYILCIFMLENYTHICKASKFGNAINPLKTIPEYATGFGLWEMCVIAKSNHLQQVDRKSS